MKIVYFDTCAGISGDMTLGAFVSAGLPFDELRRVIGDMNLPGVELEASHLTRSGIDAVKVDVIISAEDRGHRHLGDILALIERSPLADVVKGTAGNIFRTVAAAEAKIHRTTPEKVHFHEVGALDSIVDIVGAAFCLNYFGISEAYSSPVKLGSGDFVETQHGRLPLPGPAALEILRGYPVVLTDVPYELTTPTGAAIIKVTSRGMLAAERMRIGAIGYGAGTMEIQHMPNLLRVMIGDLVPAVDEEDMMEIETNIDDMSPEMYPHIVERLLQAGAVDAYLVPIIMKKGRPGVVLSVLADRTRLDGITRLIFAETTTIGLRITPVGRRKLERMEREISTRWGRMMVKVVRSGGEERLVPEYEECRRIALEHDIALRDVYHEIERSAGRG